MSKPFFRRFTKRTMIILNMVMGILFILGCYVKYFDPVSWWFLGLLTLSLPYLLFILLLFVIFWIVAKPFWLLISLVVFATTFSPIQDLFSFHYSPDFSLDKKPATFRVMSWNVELFNILSHKTHPEKRQEMFDLINHYNPDIACFQEVVAGSKTKSINYFPDIINALKFTDYLYSYQIRFDFDANHHFGILILSKFPIARKQTMVNNPDDYNSTFQFVDLCIGEDTVRVFNLHLQSLKFSEENRHYLDKGSKKTQENIKESRNIITKIKTGIIKRASQAAFIKDEMNHSPYPVIVCGDFNDVPLSYAYETIGEGLQNAFVKKGFGISRTFSDISPTLRIDNIFASSHFEITQYTRIKKVLSDHFPIIADMRIITKDSL
ncbi:MAG: endonuclease/exonuclease/phosphatase family protein [Ginsengibacter sp.]